MDPIVCPDIEFDPEEEDLSWTDNDEDHMVDNMVRLAKEWFKFTNDMFSSGCNATKNSFQEMKKG